MGLGWALWHQLVLRHQVDLITTKSVHVEGPDTYTQELVCSCGRTEPVDPPL